MVSVMQRDWPMCPEQRSRASTLRAGQHPVGKPARMQTLQPQSGLQVTHPAKSILNSRPTETQLMCVVLSH